MKFLLILPLLVSTVLSTFPHHHGDFEGHTLGGLIRHKILEKIRPTIEEIEDDHHPAVVSLWINTRNPYYNPQLYPPHQGPALNTEQPDLEEEPAIIHHDMKPVVIIPIFRLLHPYYTKPLFESSEAIVGSPGKVGTAIEENIEDVFTEKKSPFYPSTVVEERKISTLSNTDGTGAYQTNVYPYVRVPLVKDVEEDKYFPFYPKSNRVGQINYPTAVSGSQSRYMIPPRGLGYFPSLPGYYKRPNFPYYEPFPFRNGAFQRYPPMGRLNGQVQGISNGQNAVQGGINGQYPSQIGTYGQNNIPTGEYQQYPTNTGGIPPKNARGPVTFESRFKEEAVKGKNSTEAGGTTDIEEKVVTTAPSSKEVVGSSEGEVVVGKGLATVKASDCGKEVKTNAEEVIETGGITEVVSAPGASTEIIEGDIETEKVTEVGEPSDIVNGVDLGPVTESNDIGAVSSNETESEKVEHSEENSNTVANEYVSEIAQRHGVSENEIDPTKVSHGLEPLKSVDHAEIDLANEHPKIQTSETTNVVGDPQTISFTIQLPPKTITTKTVTQVSEHKLKDGTEVSVEPIQRTEKIEHKTLPGNNNEPIVTSGPNGVQISFGSSKDAINHGSDGQSEPKDVQRKTGADSSKIEQYDPKHVIKTASKLR